MTRRIERLRKMVSALPEGPGVYELLDRKGRVLYVGKAKNLPQRLKHYLRRGDPESDKLADLVSKMVDVRVTPTDSEEDALDLEVRMIIRLRPPYNVTVVRATARVRSPREPTLRVQVMEHIRERIRCQDLKPGDRLPKYAGLAAELRVSPGTVEWAYWGLQGLGLVTRIPHVAWVVTADAMEHVDDEYQHVAW